jgi:preprotein translocase subunit Sec61beta
MNHLFLSQQRLSPFPTRLGTLFFFFAVPLFVTLKPASLSLRKSLSLRDHHLSPLLASFFVCTFLSFKQHIMRVTQRRVAQAGAGPRQPVNDLEPTGFTIAPMQLVVACAAFIVTVILLHFFVKLTGKM